MQRLQISAIVGILVIGAASTRPMAGQSSGARDGSWEARLIGSLDACVQERFTNVDNVFGFRRIVRPGETAHRFRPENIRELEEVRELEQANLQVVLYLAAREVLRSSPNPLLASRVVRGPALVTPDHFEVADAPAPLQLWDESRLALQAFDRGETHRFTVSGWTFVARPVRASEQSCLNCHRADALRLGDPIGAVLYGYKRGG
jgi:hypothetical protein